MYKTSQDLPQNSKHSIRGNRRALQNILLHVIVFIQSKHVSAKLPISFAVLETVCYTIPRGHGWYWREVARRVATRFDGASANAGDEPVCVLFLLVLLRCFRAIRNVFQVRVRLWPEIRAPYAIIGTRAYYVFCYTIIDVLVSQCVMRARIIPTCSRDVYAMTSIVQSQGLDFKDNVFFFVTDR